jgi:hypothetical protein
MAAPPRAGDPLGMPVVQRHTFHIDVFGDPTKDPWHGDCATLLAPFDISVNNNQLAPTPAEVRDSVNASAANLEPIVLLILHEGKARCYLCPCLMNSTLGTTYPQAIEGHMFALDGDLHQNHGTIVDLPHSLFNQIINAQPVPTVAEIEAQLAAHPELELIGPLAAGDANTELVRTRNVVPVPFIYAQMFLAQEEVAPRYFFEAILPAIRNDQKERDCQPLIRFFQIAITRAAAPNQGSVLNVAQLPTGRRLSQVTARFDRILQHHFPSLNANLQNLQSSNIATQVAALTQAYQSARMEDAQQRASKERKTVEAWLGPHRFMKLLRLHHSHREEDLTLIWRTLAQAKSAEHLPILQAAIEVEKESLGVPHLSLNPDLALLKTMLSMVWSMADKDSIGSGFQPFRFSDTNEEAALAHIQHVSLVMGEGAAATLEDALKLTEQKVTLPSPTNANLYLLRTLVIARVFLGHDHPMVVFLAAHHADMESFRFKMTGYTPSRSNGLSSMATGVLTLKAVTNIMSTYWGNQAAHANPLPIAQSPTWISDAVSNELVWEPQLSELFIEKYNVRRLFGNQGPRDNQAQQDQSLGTPTTGGEGSRVNNLSYSTVFDVYRRRQVRTQLIRDLIRRNIIQDPLPSSKVSGVQGGVCLGWHIKGQCNSSCSKKDDHVAYTEAEYAPLLSWCNSHYPASGADALAALGRS